MNSFGLELGSPFVERADLGQNLFSTNTAIHSTRQEIRSLLGQQPINHLQVAERRAQMAALQSERRGLLVDLDAVKVVLDVQPTF